MMSILFAFDKLTNASEFNEILITEKEIIKALKAYEQSPVFELVIDIMKILFSSFDFPMENKEDFIENIASTNKRISNMFANFKNFAEKLQNTWLEEGIEKALKK